jgi:hypothetical protein
MDSKTMNKKGMTFSGLIISVLLGVGIFIACYLFIIGNANQAGVIVDNSSNVTYTQLIAQSKIIDSGGKNISENLRKIGEADNAAQVAWNGLRGLGSTLLISISFLNPIEEIFEIFVGQAGETIPGWAKGLIVAGLVLFVSLLILSILKGDSALVDR